MRYFTTMYCACVFSILLLHVSRASKELVHNTKAILISPSWKVSGQCEQSWSYEYNHWKTNLPYDSEYEQHCYLHTNTFNIGNANHFFIKIRTLTRRCSQLKREYPLCTNYMRVFRKKGQKYMFLAQLPNREDRGSAASYIIDSILELNNITHEGSIQLAFLAKKTSQLILQMSVFYYECPEVTEAQLAQFEPSSAPDGIRKMKRIMGKCVANAQLSQNSTRVLLSCVHNGTYHTEGVCVCNPGYFKNRTFCQACHVGTYKSKEGNHACAICGENTFRRGEGQFKCECKKEYFYLKNEDFHCYEAGKVRRLVYSNYSDGSVVVHWDPAYRRPGYKPVYFISFNNVNMRTTNRELRFTPSNKTRSFTVQIVTEVMVRGKVYRSAPLREIITVHKYQYNFAGKKKAGDMIIVSLLFLVLIENC